MNNMKIQPVNGHLLIEPVIQDSFISSSSDKYQEIGVVIGYDRAINGGLGDETSTSTPTQLNSLRIRKGDKVYFDSWLAAKFPKVGTKDFYWLVKWEDVRAVEHAEVSE